MEKYDLSPVLKYFSELKGLHQLLVLEAYSAIPLPHDLESMAIYANLPPNELIDLQDEVRAFLNDLRDQWYRGQEEE